MSQRKFSKRPNCYQILNEHHLWALCKNELEIDQNLNKILESENEDFSVESMIKLRFTYKWMKSLSVNDGVIGKPPLERKLNSIKS
jgi:hypothetical protein